MHHVMPSIEFQLKSKCAVYRPKQALRPLNSDLFIVLVLFTLEEIQISLEHGEGDCILISVGGIKIKNINQS